MSTMNPVTGNSYQMDMIIYNHKNMERIVRNVKVNAEIKGMDALDEILSSAPKPPSV